MGKTRRRQKGTGSITKLPNGKYKLTMTLGTDFSGKQVRKSVTADTLAEVKAKANKIRVEIDENPLGILPTKGKSTKPTFAQWCVTFLERQSGLSESTKHSYSMCVRRFNTFIGDIPIDKITASDVDNTLTALEPLLRPSSLKHYKTILSMIFREAVKSEVIVVNPVEYSRKKIKAGTRKSDLDLPTEEEIKAILEEAKKYLRDRHPIYELLVLMLTTGLRDGEAIGLKRDCISIVDVEILGKRTKKGLVKVRQQSTDYEEEASLKTDTSYRDIYVEPYVVEMLLSLPRGDEGGFVFNNFRTHQHYGASALKQAANYFLNKCFLNKLTHVPVTLYTFRHIHATTLMKNSVNIKQVSKRLGHKSIQITGDMYAHFLTEEDAKTTGIFDSLVLNEDE